MGNEVFAIQIEEAFRLNAEDTLVFRVLLKSKTDRELRFAPNGFSLRVGERTYPQSISGASGVILLKAEVPAYFAVTGTPNGGRNDTSLKNDFYVILEAKRVEPPAKETPPEEKNESARRHHVCEKPDPGLPDVLLLSGHQLFRLWRVSKPLSLQAKAAAEVQPRTVQTVENRGGTPTESAKAGQCRNNEAGAEASRAEREAGRAFASQSLRER